MTDVSDEEPLLATNGPPVLDLFMTVVRVHDWSNAVRFYTDTLGLAPVLLDPQREFALLAAGQGRLGLQGVKGLRDPSARSRVRLVFEVADLDRERDRLIETGVSVSAPFENRDEGYREARLHDPDGNSLTLFGWVEPGHNGRSTRKQQ